jgi:hypothetical protein
MFIQRIQIAAADSIRHWTSTLKDEAASRVWMATHGCPEDVSAAAADAIAAASTSCGPTRRAHLEEAFWTEHGRYFPVLGAARARLLACSASTARHVREPAAVNASQFMWSGEMQFPLNAMSQSKIEGNHRGFFDEVVCVWPWEGTRVADLFSVIMPSSVIVLVEPGPPHSGWCGWAGFTTYEFAQSLETAAKERQYQLRVISTSGSGGVMVTYFGVEAL